MKMFVDFSLAAIHVDVSLSVVWGGEDSHFKNISMSLVRKFSILVVDNKFGFEET